ncbi:MAG: HEAT repeat domain-containing protein [Proteobacteria bacterium]|nr:HEAT repeat domain-containing protein [Pseudomonadota bacterium]
MSRHQVGLGILMSAGLVLSAAAGGAACAQETLSAGSAGRDRGAVAGGVQAGSADSEASGGTESASGGSVASGSSQGSAAPRSRMRRTIENREFDDRDKIILLLNAHCDFPTREDLLLTSADAEVHLHSILNDDSLLFSVRMRALEALAYFDTPQNRQMLEKILAHPEQMERPMMLMQAIIAYPKVAPETAPAVLEPFLASDNDMIRFVTISSLKKCPGEAAVEVLRSRYAVEGNRFFQMRLKSAIDEHCREDRSCRR